MLSINSIFHALCHCFIAFSRSIASVIIECSSNHTSSLIPYLCVNPEMIPLLCCSILLIKFDVTPMYKVPLGLFVNRYTQGLFITLHQLAYYFPMMAIFLFNSIGERISLNGYRNILNEGRDKNLRSTAGSRFSTTTVRNKFEEKKLQKQEILR